MKLYFKTLLLILSGMVVSCAEVEFQFDAQARNEVASQLKISHLNICVLGNSYSNDSFSYVPFILKEYGITCKIHIYYRGSLSLHDLDEQWEDDNKYGKADLDGGNHNRLHFSIDTRKENSWRTESISSAKDILGLDTWDIISLQQGGRRAQYEETYYPYLHNVIEKIISVCPYSYSLAWFMAYNAARDNANIESVLTQKKIVSAYPFDMVFPVATAIFSCQENGKLSELGDSEYKKMYASDNVHLQEGLPCYIASLTIAQTLLEMCSDGLSVIGNQVRPTQQWIRSINGLTQNGKAIGVTEENCVLAQRAAITSNQHPFEIIPVQ